MHVILGGKLSEVGTYITRIQETETAAIKEQYRSRPDNGMEEQETGNRPSQPQWRDDMNVMSKVHRKFHTLLFAEGYDGMIQAPIPILVKNKERAKECWYPPNSRHLYLHAPRTSVKRSCRENDVCSRFR